MKNSLLLLAFILMGIYASAQVSGDFRSKFSGSWSSTATWEYFNGASWANATEYPGQSTIPETVTILDGHSVTLEIGTMYPIGSLVIGGGTSGSLMLEAYNFTVQSTITINQNATFDVYNGAFQANGNVEVYGILTDGSIGGSYHTFNGLVTIYSGGSFQTIYASPFTFAGGITNNGVFSQTGAGAITFNAIQTIQNNGTMNFSGSVTSSANITFSGNSPITFSGNYTISGASQVTNQNSYLTIIGYLTGNDAASEWINSSNSTLVLESLTAVMDMGVFNTYTYPNKVVYTGMNTQSIKEGTYNKLTIYKTSGDVSLNGNIIVQDTLTMINGNIITNSYTLTLGESTIISGVLEYIYGTIIGNFERWITSSVLSYDFPVGDAANYRPLNLKPNAITTEGSVTVSFVQGDPGIMGLPLSDGAYNVSNQFIEGSWNVVANNGFDCSDYDIGVSNMGFSSYMIDNNTRVIQRESAGNWMLSGVHFDADANNCYRNNVTNAISQTGTDFALGYTECPLPENAGTISGPASVCEGTTSNVFSVLSINGATKYAWNLPANFNIVSGDSTESITVEILPGAMSGDITVFGRNACGDGMASQTFPVMVNQLPAAAGAIGGPSNVCEGSTNMFSIPEITNAVDYFWSLPTGINIISGDNTNNITVEVISGMSGDITVYAANACGNGSGSANYPVTVNPIPDNAGIVSGPTNVCEGSNTAVFSVSVINGASDYFWNLPSGFSILFGNNTNEINVEVMAGMSGNISVYGSNICGNGGISSNHPVTIDPLPDAAGMITGPSTVCEGVTVMYSVAPVNGADIYVWNLPSGFTITSGVNTNNISVSVAGGAMPGNITVYATNMCGDGMISTAFPVMINPTPNVIATPFTETICSGSSTNIGLTSGVPATTFNWIATGINGIMGATNSMGSMINQMLTTTGSVSGNVTYVVTPEANGCMGMPENVVVNVNPIPNISFTPSSQTICSGNNTAINMSSIVAGTTFSWTVVESGVMGAYPSSGNVINQTLTVSGTMPGTATYTVMPTANACSGVPENVIINVTPIPSAGGAITGPTNGCLNATGLIYSVPTIDNATSYSWNLPTGWNITTGWNTNNITVEITAGAASGNISVSGTNACGNGTQADLFVNVDYFPDNAGMISGPSNVCEGSNSAVFSVPTITGATDYMWNLPSGFSIIFGDNTNEINVEVISGMSGDISVYGSNLCGNGGISSNYPVMVNPMPDAAGMITGPSNVCEGVTNIMYSIAPVNGADSYVWDLPVGFNITMGLNTNNISVDIMPSAMPGDITVYATNMCGDGIISPALTVTVAPPPTAYAGADQSVCANNSNITLSGSVTIASGGIWISSGSGNFSPNANTLNAIYTPSPGDISGGNITLTLTSTGNGTCDAVSDNMIVGFTPAPTINAGSDQSVCASSPTVTLSGNVTNASSGTWSGGMGSYSPGNTVLNCSYTPSAGEISAGTVTLTLTTTGNGNCLAESDQITITINPNVTASIQSQTNVSCFGGNNATITTGAIGGTPGYNYIWDAGTGNQTTQTALGLTAGSYTVTVTDSKGCSGTATGTVTQPPSLSLAPSQINGSCYGSFDGTATATVSGGTPVYIYIWDAGTGNQTTQTATGLTAGSYTVTVKDANLCEVSNTFTITQPDAITFTESHAPVTCNGLSNGIINNIFASGGTPSYQYSINNGSNWSGSNTFTGLTAGSYQVLVKDVNNCFSNVQNITITQPPTLSLSTTVANVLCNGEASGTIDLSVTGGTSPYSYTWTGGSTMQDLSNIPAGTYSVAVQDANLCSASISVTVTEPTIINLATTTVNVTCNGTSTGSIDLTVSGGSGTYTYSWTGGSTMQDIINIPSGSYTVTVTDGFGCIQNTTAVITEPTILVVDAGTGQAICQGDNLALGAGATGGNGGYSYLWDNGAGTISNPTVSPTVTTTYSVTVTDLYGCTASNFVTITVNPIPAAAGTITGPSNVCEGATGILYSVPAIGNATGYNWNLPTGFSITGGSNTNNITVDIMGGAISGNITVQGTNTCGTGSVSMNLPVTVNSGLPVSISIIEDANNVCQNTNVTFTATPVNPGTTPFYIWKVNGAPVGPNSPTYSASNLVNGDQVTCELTSNEACVTGNPAVSNTITMNVLSFLPVSVSITADATEICEGTNVQFTANPTNGGASPVYVWKINGAQVGSNSFEYFSNTLLNGDQVTCELTSDAQCSTGNPAISNTISMIVNPLPEAAGTITGPSNVCEGATGIMYSVASIGNATGYNWNLPSGFSITGGANTNNITVEIMGGAMSGDITVYGTNACGNGMQSSVHSITVNPLPVVNAGSDASIAMGTSANLLGSVSGGSGDYTYSWLPADSLMNAAIQNPTTVNLFTSNLFTLNVTDNVSGCQNTDNILITVTGGALTINASAVNDIICEGESTIMNAIASGGSGTYTYSWTPSTNLDDYTIASPTAIPATTTMYTVEVNDGFTTATADVTISVNALPVVTATNTGPGCELATIELNASGGILYNWSGPNAFSSTEYNPILINVLNATHNGTYSVTVTDPFGCSAVGTTDVVVFASPVATASSNSPVCEGADIILTGSGGNIYGWSGPLSYTSSEQNPTIINTTSAMSGTYTLSIADANGCSSTATTEVIVNTLPVATASNNGPVCEGTELNLTASGGIAYSWIGPAFTSSDQYPVFTSIDLSSAGIYNVTVTDVNGCEAVTSTEVFVYTVPTVTAENDGPVCEGADLTLIVNSGVSYSWSGPSIFASSEQYPVITGFSPSMTGIYYVTVTSTNGCEGVGSTEVSINPLPVATISSNSPVCEGADLLLSATGGVAYDWNGPDSFTASAQNPQINGVTSLAAGFYTVTVIDDYGCTAVENIEVFINSVVLGTDVITSCESFTWIDGITYTESNNIATFNIVGGAANGCDSLVTLNLTINPAATGVDVQTACGSYIWIDSLTYTVSNNTATFIIIGGAANGCDSLVTLNLTINPAATGIDVQTACDSYIWIDGLTYTESNNTATFNIVGGAANGCDSLVTLNLIISNGYSETVNASICDGESYTLPDGSTVYTSDTYISNFTNLAGCDSIITTNLIVNVLPNVSFTGLAPEYCKKQQFVLLVGSPTAGVFSGSGMTNNVFNPLNVPVGNNTITYTYTDNNNCTNIYTQDVIVNANPNLSISSVVDASCNQTNGSALITATGGIGPYTYSTGSDIMQNLNAGTYPVTVTDSKGCQVSTQVVINNIGAPVIAMLSASDASCSISCNGSASIDINGGTQPYTVLWSSGETTQNASSLCVGLNNVVVTDATGCIAADTVFTNFSMPDPTIYGRVSYSGGNIDGQHAVLNIYSRTQQSGGGFNQTPNNLLIGSDGTYFMYNFHPDEYILRVMLTDETYPNLLNSYYKFNGIASQWDSASIIILGCGDMLEANITMYEFPVLDSGNGLVGGAVYYPPAEEAGMNQGTGIVISQGKAVGEPVPGAEIYIELEPDDEPIMNSTTDENGEYEFVEIPNGNYSLRVEIPGFPMLNTYELTINETDTAFNGLTFYVDTTDSDGNVDTSLVSIPTAEGILFDVAVFPNPYTEIFNINYQLYKNAAVTIELFDIQGKLVKTIANEHQIAGDYSYNMNSRSFTMLPGTYIIRLRVDNTIYLKKIIQNE